MYAKHISALSPPFSSLLDYLSSIRDARAPVWSFSSLYMLWHQSENDGQESEKKKKHKILLARARFFFSNHLMYVRVCVLYS